MLEPIFVSIVVPVFNREETVLMSIQSLLNQTYSNFEILVINDASTDRTKQIIESINDIRVRIINLDKNVGAAAARNIGIRKSLGNWIAFQDSDDYWEPTKLEKQVKVAMEQCNQLPSIIYTSFVRVKNNERELIPNDSSPDLSGVIHKKLILQNFIATPSVLIPKECFYNIGYFSEDMPRFQDWELWIRMSQRYPFIWINEPLLTVYYSEDSISANFAKLLQAYTLLWEKHGYTIQQAGPIYASRFLFSYGHNLAIAGKMKKAREIFKKSIKFRTSLLNCSGFILSCFGQQMYRFVYFFISKKGKNKCIQ
ncbi:Hyaluronan synthase [Chlamydia abortus]|uniref:glycosyltransferase family 2 protein n=1 Tax=Paenibacillus sp. SAFN-117 TaxID=3436860 RepID=UPI000A27B39F|nr:Hyaluronan synthase [Chlamydia abortus]